MSLVHHRLQAANESAGSPARTVREEQQHWREQEVYSVPTFFFQQQYMVPGAQEADTFARLLKKIHTRGDCAAQVRPALVPDRTR